MKNFVLILGSVLILSSASWTQANMANVAFNDNLSNQILCPGEQLLVNILGPVTPPSDMSVPGVVYSPGIGIAVFGAAPSYTNNDVLNDPNLLAFIQLQNQAAFFSPIAISYSDLVNTLPPPIPNNLTTTTSFFLQVITIYSVQNNVPYVNGVNGNPDLDASTTYTISLQPKPAITTSEDCANNALIFSVALPGNPSGTITLQNNYPNVSIAPNNISYNQNFTITGISNQSPVGFEYINNQGCSIALDTIYTGTITATINTPVSSVCENGSPFDFQASPSQGIWTCSTPSMMMNNTFIPSAQDISVVTNYTVTFTPTLGASGCNASTSVTVDVEPEVIAQITGPNSMCNNAPLQSYSSDIQGGIWNTDFNAIDQNGNLNPQLLTPGLHTINYTPLGNCSVTAQYDIVIDFLPNLHITTDTTQGCVPLMIQLTDLTPGNISDRHWIINGQSFPTNNAVYQHVFENAYCYDVALASLNEFGCRDTLWRTDYICPFPNPYMSFGFMPQHPDIANPEVNFFAGNTAVESVVWDFGDGTGAVEFNPTHYFANTVPAEFQVCITAVDENLCSTKICDFVTVSSGFKLYMPNAYTPDQDGLNDGFRPVMDSERELAKYAMMIFNRDGELIFETDNHKEAWYGNSNEGDYYVKDGVYTWKIKVWLYGDVEPKVYSGNVIIVR